jgi:hypothetical protein
MVINRVERKGGSRFDEITRTFSPAGFGFLD